MNSSMLSLIVGAGLAGAASWMLSARNVKASQNQQTNNDFPKNSEESKEKSNTNVKTEHGYDMDKENTCTTVSTHANNCKEGEEDSLLSPPDPSKGDATNTSTLLSSQILNSSKLNSSIAPEQETNLNISKITPEDANLHGESLNMVLCSTLVKIVIDHGLIEKALSTDNSLSQLTSKLLYTIMKLRIPDNKRIINILKKFQAEHESQLKSTPDLKIKDMIKTTSLYDEVLERDYLILKGDETKESYHNRVNLGYKTFKELGISAASYKQSTCKKL